MKKFINKLDKKFIISLLIIIALLSTVAVYQIYATITAEEESKGDPSHAVPEEGKYITLQDLYDMYDILCCYHGGDDAHLPSANNVILRAAGKETSTTDSGKEIGKLIKGDEGETALTVEEEEIDEDSPYTEASYTAETYAFYKVTSTEVARPKEAYILAEMIEELDGGAVFTDQYSVIQYAWWTTVAGSKGATHVPENDLALEATAFEAYIAKVANTDPSTFVEQAYEFEDEFGNVHSGTVPAPVIDYVAQYNEDANQDGEINRYDDVTTCWDEEEQEWTIGPFSIDYIEEGDDHSPARPPVEFAAIKDAKLFTDLGEMERHIIQGADDELPAGTWDFEYIAGQRDTADTYQFPHKNEVFYIRIKFIPGVTKITNLHFDFKYMNAGGKFDSLKGEYFVETWTPQSEEIETCPGKCVHGYSGSHTYGSGNTVYTCPGTCSHGRSGEHATKWKYWLELTGMKPKTAQLLAYGIIGARWYEEAALDIDIPEAPHEGRIKIVKQIVDKDGNLLNTTDRTKLFTFKIYKDGELYDTVQVSQNKSYVSPVFTWEDGETAPSFRVEEVLEDEDYEQYGAIEMSGNIENGLVIFVAKNTPVEKSGRITIRKEQIGTGLEDKVFSFKLYIDGKVYAHVPETAEDGTITLKVGESWTSPDITWTGSKAPNYKVNEINLPEGAKLVNLENDTGTLIEDKTVLVVAKNMSTDKEYERGTLVLRKVLESGERTDELFYFRVRVGNMIFYRALHANETWTQTFIWEKGTDAPRYEVEEIRIPKGFELVEIRNATGTLSPNGEKVEVVCVNAETKSGRVSITKQQIGTGLEGQEFSFNLYIDGKLYSEEPIKVKVGETWESEEITWTGRKAPKYEVKEVNIPAGARLVSIENAKGSLVDGKTVRVVAKNTTDTITESGKLTIKKYMKEGDTPSDEQFKFQVTVGNETYIVGLRAGDSWTGEFSWEKSKGAPTYDIQELEIPEGYELVEIRNATGTLSANSNAEVICINGQIEKKGRVSITKEQLGTGLEDKEFSFNLYIDGKLYSEEPIKVKVGETWTSEEIVWKGDSPRYSVSEINIPEGAKLVSIENSNGYLIENETVAVVARNESDGPKYEKATITLKKVLDGNITSDETFHFQVKVGNEVFDKALKAGQTWTETFVWEKGTEAPSYEVTELDIPEGFKLIEIKNASGTLSADGNNIEIIAINDAEKEKSGTIQIHKETVSDDKEGVDENDDTFTFVTRISGTFEMGGESIVNGTKTITSTLKSGDTVTLDEVKWKGDAPTYTVTETELPDGWTLQSISNSSGTVRDGETITVNCVNEFKIRVEYDLTMEMAGRVWEDKPINEEDKNTEDSVANGKYDNGIEEGIEKVEVIIWKKLYDASGNELENLRKHATAYENDSNVEIEFPLYTSPDGIWEAPRMSVPGLLDEEKEAGAVKADYDVEFIYDGQTYKPTDFLVSGDVASFRKASNSEKSKYLNDSMAYEVEEERNAFDQKFEVITGDSPIDDNGVTEGYATDAGGNVTVEQLEYYSTDSLPSVENNTRKISELQTTEDGYVREPFKMSARTSTGGLTYPFDDKVHLENVKKTIDKIRGGLVIRYEYSATYPYLLNVNLGLVRRDEAELSVTKDVYSATTVVNQKMMNYKYNEYIDFENEKYQDYLDLQLKVADANISYKLDLYESDYYYRAKVYEENATVNGALQEFYRSIGKTDLSDELDLDVFLTYKVSVYNNSDSYLALVRNLVDYFDEDLELVTEEQTKYIQEANGTSVDATTVVASPAYVIKKGQAEAGSWGELANKSLAGKVTADYGTKYASGSVDAGLSNSSEMVLSNNVRTEDGKSYYKANIDLSDNDLRLAVGEKLEIYLTFKVRTDETPAQFTTETDATNSYVRLGTKANIAEIGAYTTYYTDGKVAGRVEKDSAPNNVDIENKNEKSWYEDDTDSAPIITLDLYTETRNVNGFAWEDAETEKLGNDYYNQVIGNGIYDEGERLIGNLTTEMVEKVRVKQSDGTYKEYDFVWPTATNFDFLENRTLEELTGFDSITLTSNAPENTGVYGFKNIPAGNYVVRFVYGYFPSDSHDSATGNLVPLSGEAEPKTSDDNSRHPAVYNGQDFKTTAYQVDCAGDDGKNVNSSNAEGYIDNEWYDFSTCKYDDEGNVITHNSDAIDNEARRLEVIAYSQVLDNTITTALASANDYSADHTELYNNTAMFADTAKINLNIENMNSLAGQKIVITNELTGQTEEVYAGETTTRNGIMSNSVYGKTDVNGEKGTVSLIDYSYNIEAVDVGIEERSNNELALDKEIESITLKTNTGDTILKAVYDVNYEFTLNEDTGKSTYKAKVELNKDNSYGTENLIAQNKDEEAGLQNFRYIYYDDSISQSLNLEVVYRFTALNLGEVDRTGKVANMSKDELIAKSAEIKEQVYRKDGDKLVSLTHPNIGEYVGSIYYLGKNEAYTQNDELVKTKVRQLIDYVDNDAVFKASDNTQLDASWKSTTADELLTGKVIDATLVGNYDGVNNIVDDRDILYTTTERNNIVLSVDNNDGSASELSNPGFIIDLVPYSASAENSNVTSVPCEADMKLVMTRSIDSQIDDDDLSYDNIAEIVKFENTVGKRDIETIAGNVEPKIGEFEASLEERDSSATELITFTPPTGLDTNVSLTIEILIVTVVALTIVVIGIVIIKKKVLR